MDTGKILDFRSMFNFDSFKKRTVEPYEKKLEAAKGKVTLDKNIIGALTQARAQVKGVRKALEGLSGDVIHRLGNGFLQKQVILNPVNSTDSKAIEVTATEKATNGTLNVTVGSVATAASVRSLGTMLSAGTSAIAETVAVTINGNGPVNVGINVGDTVAVILQNMNNTLKASNVEVLAVTDPITTDTSFLFRSTQTGVGTISITEISTGSGTLGLFENEDQQNGTNASITVQGVPLTNTTNIFNNVLPGVNISVNAATTGNIAVKVTDDPEAADKKITDLIKAANSYLAFSAKQQEIKTGKDIRYVDTAYLGLKKPSLIGQLDQSIISPLVGVFAGLDANFNALSTIGIVLEKVPATDTAPEMQQLVIGDRATYINALNNNFAQVKNLFQSAFNSTPGGGNHGSSLLYMGCDQVLSSNALNILSGNYPGQTFKLKVPIVGGLVGQVQYAIDNTNSWYNATFDGSNITFPGTQFEGLKIQYQTNGVADNVEEFDVVFTQGLADRMTISTRGFTDNQGRGSIDLEAQDLYDLLDKDREMVDKAKEAMDKAQQKAEALLSGLDVEEAIFNSVAGLFE